MMGNKLERVRSKNLAASSSVSLFLMIFLFGCSKRTEISCGSHDVEERLSQLLFDRANFSSVWSYSDIVDEYTVFSASLDPAVIRRSYRYDYSDPRLLYVNTEIHKVGCVSEIHGTLDQSALQNGIVTSDQGMQYYSDALTNRMIFPSAVVNWLIDPSLKRMGNSLLPPEIRRRAVRKFAEDITSNIAYLDKPESVKYTVQLTGDNQLHIELSQ